MPVPYVSTVGQEFISEKKTTKLTGHRKIFVYISWTIPVILDTFNKKK